MLRIPPQQLENPVLKDAPHSFGPVQMKGHDLVNVVLLQDRESLLSLGAEGGNADTVVLLLGADKDFLPRHGLEVRDGSCQGG